MVKRIFKGLFFILLSGLAAYGFLEIVGFNEWHEGILIQRGLK